MKQKGGKKLVNQEVQDIWQHPESNRGSRVITVGEENRYPMRTVRFAALFNLLGAEIGEHNLGMRKTRGRGGWWKSYNSNWTSISTAAAPICGHVQKTFRTDGGFEYLV
jgi:hypothetical protein